MQNLIVGIGEILWDILPSGKVLGGAPTSFAYHVQKLGENSKVVSCVGNDELGKEIFVSLENYLSIRLLDELNQRILLLYNQ